ncbi:hypothetical protein D3C72_1877440 [compost metagenome]
MHAERAFVRGLSFMVDKARLIRAGLYAIGTANATGVIDYHNAVLPLESGLYRANRHAGRVIAVIAQPWQQHVGGRCLALQGDLILQYTGAKLPLRQLVFHRATDRACLTANAATQINQHRHAFFTVAFATGRL